MLQAVNPEPFIVVANLKSHFTSAQVQSWLKTIKPTPTTVVAPSFPHLTLAVGHSPLAVCAQDVSPFPPGSYTGAVSATQLKDLGVTYAIVGHSERRHYFHETAPEIALKVRELVSAGITPILCLEEADIIPQFGALPEDNLRSACLYCFEPKNDIGGTVTAPPDLILSVKAKITDFVPDARFMYGGSVTRDNVASLLPLGLAGVLVATASLDPHHFQAILGIVSHG